MSKRSFILFIIINLILGGAFVATSFWRFFEPQHLLQPKTLFIAPGTAKNSILQQLHAEGLLPSRVLTLAPLLFMDPGTLKAGEYRFEGEISAPQVLQTIAQGRVIAHKFTLPEGWSRYQLQEALLQESKLSGPLPELDEGRYLPETYYFTRGEPRRALLARMQQAQQDFLQEAWPNRAPDLPFHTLGDALILASIVERETGLKNEHGPVASVYSNRLRRGMRLQADPTVAYGIARTTGSPMPRALTRKDLQQDTPWNSYTRHGLPPTPIANPGKQAILAVLNPPETPYLYFVATGTGGHKFATSLDEHNRNVADYRAILHRQTEE